MCAEYGSAISVEIDGRRYVPLALRSLYDRHITPARSRTPRINSSRPRRGVNEVYRAELMAIHAAPAHHEASDLAATPAHVYTDSLCALHADRGAVFRQHSVPLKLRSQLVASIAHTVAVRAHRGCHTHLCEIKSHSGIDGSDRADAAAEVAALLSVTTYDVGP